MEQRLAVLVSAIVGTLVIAVFAAVARSARSPGSAEDIAASASRWRRTTFWGLVVLFVPAIAFSLTKTPYGRDKTPATVVVQATGHQWAWEVAPSSVPAGQPVPGMPILAASTPPANWLGSSMTTITSSSRPR